MPPPPPPPPPQHNEDGDVPFWNFGLPFLDPSQPHGRGVDHHGPQPNFPFSYGGTTAPPPPAPPAPPAPPGPPGSGPTGPTGPTGPHYGGFGGFGGWIPGGRHWAHHAGGGGGRGRGGRHWGRGGHRHDHGDLPHHSRRHGSGTNDQPHHYEAAPSSDDEKRHHAHVHDEVDDESDTEDGEKTPDTESPETMRVDDPEEVAPGDEEEDQARGRFGRRGGRCGGGRGGPRGRCHGRRGGFPFGGRHGAAPWSQGQWPSFGQGHGAQPFDWPGLVNGVVNHPYLQNLFNNSNGNNGNSNHRSAGGDEGDVFSPPVDVFNTPTAYVLHVALPGAQKDNVAVNWDPDASALTISGLVTRPGDEAFLSTLHTAERAVGLFERTVPLPPRDVGNSDPAAKDAEVDAAAITARMDNGLLTVTVPKVEKGWTEIRKVEIQ